MIFVASMPFRVTTGYLVAPPRSLNWLQIMKAESKRVAVPKKQARSRIGNGTDLLAGVDGRSAVMRRYREIYAQLVNDMGGNPSEAKSIIAKRASTLAVWCEQAEADMANGKSINMAEFTTATNALRRLLVDLGLERRAKDITPTLDQYLNENYSGQAA